MPLPTPLFRLMLCHFWLPSRQSQGHILSRKMANKNRVDIRSRSGFINKGNRLRSAPLFSCVCLLYTLQTGDVWISVPYRYICYKTYTSIYISLSGSMECTPVCTRLQASSGCLLHHRLQNKKVYYTVNILMILPQKIESLRCGMKKKRGPLDATSIGAHQRKEIRIAQ